MSAEVIWGAWGNIQCRAVVGVDSAARTITMRVMDFKAQRRNTYVMNARNAKRYALSLRQIKDPEAASLAAVVEAQLMCLKTLKRCA